MLLADAPFNATYRRNDALLDVADRATRTPAGRWLFQAAVASPPGGSLR